MFRVVVISSLFCLSVGQLGSAVAEVEYIGKDYRDPLQLPASLRAPVAPEALGAEMELPSLRVEGMVWGSRRPQAIIGGSVYEKGDVVGEMEILDISKDGITLLYKDRKFIVRPKVERPKIELQDIRR